MITFLLATSVRTRFAYLKLNSIKVNTISIKLLAI